MKKILAFLLCFVMVFALVACGSTEVDVDTDTEETTEGLFTEDLNTDSDSDVSSATQDATEETEKTDSSTDSAASDKKTDTGSQELEPSTENGPNMVMANDQIKERVVIYDFDLYEKGDTLEDLEVWSVKTGHAAGVKYREDTVFGDVVIVAGSHSAIYEYPSGKEVWGTDNPGNNTHSVEILPSGNIVLANSTGNNLRFFAASAQLEGDNAKAQSYKEYPLDGAHGVLWDPEYDVLWALGDYELAAYRVIGEGSAQTLQKVGGMGASLPEEKTGGHDLAPDYSDSQYLYLTVNACTLRFDKEENTFDARFKNYNKLNGNSVKGFGNNLNGNFFMAIPGDKNGTGTNFEGHWKASWLTDTIYFCYMKTENLMYKLGVKSEESGFYKVRVFVGQYQ